MTSINVIDFTQPKQQEDEELIEQLKFDISSDRLIVERNLVMFLSGTNNQQVTLVRTSDIDGLIRALEYIKQKYS